MRTTTAALLLILLPTLAGAAQSPYAGWESRSIKALSAQQIDDLRHGRGMSLALPAELNGYPGPKHILELREPLRLSAEQERTVRAAYADMQREVREAGIRVLEAERRLGQLFAERSVDSASLAAQVREAGERWSQLRTIHLKYHLNMVSVLTPQQRQRYQRLRGYTEEGHHHGGHGH